MNRFILYFILLFMPFVAAAQKDSARFYLDGNLQFTSKKDFVYPAMAVKQNTHWNLYSVYADTMPLLMISFADAGLTIMDGPYILYHPKKIMAQQGYFKNNIADGHWKSWYTSGQLKYEGDLINNHFSGEWETWYENGQIKSKQSYLYKEPVNAGQPFHENSPAQKVQKLLVHIAAEGLREGPSVSWYENGNKEYAVNYHNDTLSGPCVWYRDNGKLSSKETYANGKVTELECYDAEGKLTGSTCSLLKLPVLIHPMFSVLDYVEYELHKDKLKDIKQEGEASISFTVTKKGAVENLIIVSSPDAALSKHIISIFASMPAWSPAVIHNQAKDYPIQLVVPYYRE